MTGPLTPVDWHVHVHRTVEIATVLDAAVARFSTLRPGDGVLGVLMLAEMPKHAVFDSLFSAGQGRGDWHFEPTAETTSLWACRNHLRIAIVAGFQAVTRERLEILALGTRRRPQDGRPARETLDALEAEQTIAVLPWGVGKWFGARGRLVGELADQRPGGSLALGDNAGRPTLWPRPAVFATAERNGMAVLPGSDTLPGSRSTAGCFGTLVPDLTGTDRPADALRHLVADPGRRLTPFGALAGTAAFIGAQSALRLRRFRADRAG